MNTELVQQDIEIEDLTRSLKDISGETFEFSINVKVGIFLAPKHNEKVLIGGYGVTRRSLGNIFSKFDESLTLEIEKAESIIFIGNGLSLAPIELKRQFPEKKIATVDMVNYQEMKNIYTTKISEFQILEQNYPQYYQDIKKFFENAVSLVVAQSKGDIEVYNYTFGSSEIIPNNKFSLGINCYGPPKSLINEQLLLIEEEGKIFYRETRQPQEIFIQ